MKTKEEIVEALDAIQREATPGHARTLIVTAMQDFGAVMESDWMNNGQFALLVGPPCGEANYRIKPVPKVRPLNAEEWKRVAGCVYRLQNGYHGMLPLDYDERLAETVGKVDRTCHPPGFPNDIRKLWAEVAT